MSHENCSLENLPVRLKRLRNIFYTRFIEKRKRPRTPIVSSQECIGPPPPWLQFLDMPIVSIDLWKNIQGKWGPWNYWVWNMEWKKITTQTTQWFKSRFCLLDACGVCLVCAGLISIWHDHCSFCFSVRGLWSQFHGSSRRAFSIWKNIWQEAARWGQKQLSEDQNSWYRLNLIEFCLYWPVRALKDLLEAPSGTVESGHELVPNPIGTRWDVQVLNYLQLANEISNSSRLVC